MAWINFLAILHSDCHRSGQSLILHWWFSCSLKMTFTFVHFLEHIYHIYPLCWSSGDFLGVIIFQAFLLTNCHVSIFNLARCFWKPLGICLWSQQNPGPVSVQEIVNMLRRRCLGQDIVVFNSQENENDRLRMVKSCWGQENGDAFTSVLLEGILRFEIFFCIRNLISQMISFTPSLTQASLKCVFHFRKKISPFFQSIRVGS